MSDVIDRQASIEIADAIWTVTGDKNVAKVWQQLKDLPSAEPKRKRGRWIEGDDLDNRISGICSECGWESHMYEDDVVGMDYCPNCGARLEGE